jgi:hypothetical protein
LATLNLKSISTFVSNFAASVQSSAAALIDFSPGSILLSVAEASSAVGMWLQGLILTVLQVARLATSFGIDVDSFIADFPSMPPRLGNTGSSGVVTMSRYSNTQSAFIPVGAQVQSSDGSQAFTVTADPTNVNWDVLGGYDVAAGVTSIGVPVTAVNVGPATNIVAGQVNRLLSSISGIDFVSNSLPMAGGLAAETDAAVKIRFALFILGLTKGTVFGAESALANLNVSIAYQIVDGQQYNGTVVPGFYYAVVDDGSGTPSSAFLAAATNALQANKPLGVQFAVYAPALVTASIGTILTTAPGYNHGTVAGQVALLYAANILALNLGNGLPYSQIAAWAYSVAGVTNAASITLNGGTADIAANPNNRIMPGTITVS